MKTFNTLYRVLPTFLILSFLFSCQVPEQSNKVRPFELDEITIPEIQQAYKDGKYTIRQVVQLYLNRIREIDQNGPELNSIIMVNPDALQIADSLDKVMAAGNAHGPMFGIPVVLKDNIDTHDKMPTTAGSRVLKDSHPPQDSFVTKKLRHNTLRLNF